MKLSCSWIDPASVRALLEEIAVPGPQVGPVPRVSPRRVGRPGPEPAEPGPPGSQARDHASAEAPAVTSTPPAGPSASEREGVDDVNVGGEDSVFGAAAATRRAPEQDRPGQPGTVDAAGPAEATPEPPAPVATPFTSGSGDTSARIRGLVGWAISLEPVEQSFVCDADGLVVAQHEADAELVASSSWLITSWEKVERHLRPSGFGVSTVELESGRWLVLIPGVASWGKVYFGLVTIRPLGIDLITELRGAFGETLKESKES